jgi:hypothetical protein
VTLADVFNMPDDFLEGEYFKITVNATLNKSDADQSLPFDIRRPAPRTAPSDDDVKMKDPDTYSSPKEYARALAEYLTKHGPGTALVLRKAKSSLSEGTSAIFVRSIAQPSFTSLLTPLCRYACTTTTSMRW